MHFVEAAGRGGKTASG